MQDSENETSSNPPCEKIERSPTIVADIAGSFTYASYQNAIPVLRAIRIDNADGRHHESIRVELTSSPADLVRHIMQRYLALGSVRRAR